MTTPDDTTRSDSAAPAHSGIRYCAQCRLNGSGKFQLDSAGRCHNPDCVMRQRNLFVPEVEARA